jgi:hypothetical protein
VSTNQTIEAHYPFAVLNNFKLGKVTNMNRKRATFSIMGRTSGTVTVKKVNLLLNIQTKNEELTKQLLFSPKKTSQLNC